MSQAADTVSFGYAEVDPQEKTRRVGEVFSSVARRYDLMNDAMSGGMHRLWKDRFVRRVKPRAGESILDMAGGTGDVAFRLAERGAQLTVADINSEMLEVGMARAKSRGLDGLVWTEANAEALQFADKSFDAYTIAFGIRNVTRIQSALDEAHRVLKRGGRFFCLEFSTTLWPGFAEAYDAYSHHLVPKLGKALAHDEESYRYLIESIRRFPDMETFRGMIDKAGFVRTNVEPMLGGLVPPSDREVRQTMTHPATHLWRLLKWGRTLARHGALKAIERDPLTPPAVRRLVRIARLGARVPKQPAYAEAFQAIGPAAIKFGQALATRPDLVGDHAAHDLLRLQDALPPAPFDKIRASIAESLDRPVEAAFSHIDPEPVGAASIAQVHRAVTTEGREVAIKILRPGVEEEFAKALETYEWAAAQAEAFGGEIARLRPRLVVATFRQWTMRELDLRREAASASELAEAMEAEPGYCIPSIDWARTSRRVMTLEWIEGVKLSRRDDLIAAGHDPADIAARLVRAFLRQAISEGFFHADMHQGNLFVRANGDIVAIDFGIMGRIDRKARMWLAEILHGLITGNYARVAEIHFEAGYVPPHHNIAEFTTALRAVGEPIRGLPVKDISIGQMLDGLFAITRDFDMPTQPHLLLLQKTMVMVEGVATALDPDINMWETSGPFVKEWLRTELGPEAWLADRIVTDLRTLARLPDLLRNIEARYPPPGAAPPPPPLRDVEVVQIGGGWRYMVVAIVAAAAGAAITLALA